MPQPNSEEKYSILMDHFFLTVNFALNDFITAKISFESVTDRNIDPQPCSWARRAYDPAKIFHQR